MHLPQKIAQKVAQTSSLLRSPKPTGADWKSALLLPVFLLAATWLPASPKLPLANLVDDQTLLALSVSDVPALLRGWDVSPLAASWSDPQIVKFLAPLREQMQVDQWDADTQAATGLSVRELLGLVEGEVLFALPSFDFSQANSSSVPAFLLALEVGARGSKIEKILADAAEKRGLKEETETFAGVRVHVRPLSAPRDADADDAGASTTETRAPRTLAWALVEGVWLISTTKERVFAAIDAVQQGGLSASLGASERFQRTRQRVGPAQALAYLNLPAIYPLVQEAVVASKAKSAGKPNPLGLDPEVVLKALGLDVLGEAYAAVALEPTQARLDTGLAYTEERGVMRLVAYQPGPTSQPDWVPAKWPNVSTARFSVPKAYAGLEALVNAVSPMLFGMAQGQMRSFDKKLGVDLRRDLIGSLGDDLVTAYALPPGQDAGTVPAWTQMDQLIAVSLVNEEAFLRSVNALKALAGPAADQLFTQRDYLGNTLYTLNVPTAPGASGTARGFSYAIAQKTLLVGIGSPATVEGALQGMASGAGGFWQRADVKAALTDLPSDAVSLQVQDLRVLLASLVESVVGYQAALNAGKPAGAKPSFVDVEARPAADVWARHWGLSAGYVTRTPEGLFSTTRLVYPQP
jgi:hypothetical protein